ncbi:MAG: hypothetical protein ACLP8A_00685 [Methylovirgula sp.]
MRTLVPLVQASARGIVRDVVLAGPPEGELATIAEHAGCAVVVEAVESKALAGAFDLARSQSVMLFQAGHVPEVGFFEEVEDFFNIRKMDESRRLQAAPDGFFERLLPQLSPTVGLIAGRGVIQSDAVSTFPALVRASGARQALKRRLRRIG